MILAPTLSLSAGSGAAIVRPTFSRDFAGEKTLNNGTGPAITFTRGSDATYFDADGVLQTATNDTPRFDHDPADGASRGLLIEEARTNSLRNSQAGGATTGVIGSGGALPTYWAIAGEGTLAVEIIGTGTSAGLAYVDIKISGTTSTTALSLNYEGQTQVSAATGQSWTTSNFVALEGGSVSNIDEISTRVRENSVGGSVLQTGKTALTPTASLTRYSHARTLTEATTERVAAALFITFSSGATIDITLRIAAPQLEQGAFPTSYIPTTTAAATRAADSAVVTPISSFYNASEGTLFAEASSTAFVSGDNQGLWGFGDDTLTFATGNMMYATHLASVSHRIAIGVIVSGASTVSSLNNGGVPQSANVPARSIFGYKTDDFAISTNGSSVATDTSGALPVVTGFSIGGLQKAWASGGNQLNGHIRKIAYWPKRLTNTLLQQLTT